MMQSRSSRIASLGILVTLGILFGYLESFIVLPIGIPGIKIGLSNIVTVVTLYMLNPLYAGCVLIARVIISSILFGNGLSAIYSIVGALASFLLMVIFRRINSFSLLGVSVAGGVAHNIAQLAVATVLIGTKELMLYLPVLIISGTIAGVIVGIISKLVIRRLDKALYNRRGYL